MGTNNEQQAFSAPVATSNDSTATTAPTRDTTSERMYTDVDNTLRNGNLNGGDTSTSTRPGGDLNNPPSSTGLDNQQTALNAGLEEGTTNNLYGSCHDTPGTGNGGGGGDNHNDHSTDSPGPTQPVDRGDTTRPPEQTALSQPPVEAPTSGPPNPERSLARSAGGG